MGPSAPLLLAKLREARGFDPALVLESKVGRINEWMKAEMLDAAVMGVSGGVDSALALALLVEASKRPGSPLRRLVALLLPFPSSSGATTQPEATARGRLVTRSVGLADEDVWEAPLDEALRATTKAIAKASKLAFRSWSEGQCLSVMRTPALYGAVALLQETQNLKPVVFGTTNRDEGAYIGFFGKASDGMVDVQPIADLHKSEVRALARHLGCLPDDIIDAVPRGDVHDGRTDEEMIGATYDQIETYLRLREVERDPRVPLMMKEDPATLLAASKIEALRRQNRHKYGGGRNGFAVYLDVLPRAVPGGALETPFSNRDETPPPPETVPGAWVPSPAHARALEPCSATFPKWSPIALAHAPTAFAIRIHQALTTKDAALLRDAMKNEADALGIAEPVDVTGVKGSELNRSLGSMRATAWSVELAQALFTRIRPAVPSVRFLDDHAFTDAYATKTRFGACTWRLVGLSPLLRFMRYANGGEHLCHYDAGFDYGDGRRTLMSVVFYLTDAAADGSEGGATRFLRDGQEKRRTKDRSFEDWTRATTEADIVASVIPSEGDVLIFDHRLGHDVQKWMPQPPEKGRVIIRGDVVYEAVPDGRRLPL